MKSQPQQQLEEHLRQLESTLDGSSQGDQPLISSGKLRELVAAVDPTQQIDPVVEEMLLQIADDFVYNVASGACQLAVHRKSKTLDISDVQLHLEKQWNVRVPGFSVPEVSKPLSKRPASEQHQRRLERVKRSQSKRKRAQQ